MSINSTDSMDEEAPNLKRARTHSIYDLMMTLNPKGPGAATDGATIVECLLDILCVKYSSKSAGMTINEDSLRTNIIGEL